jgi:hypothetical protein
MADALSLFRVMSYNCCGFSVNKTCYIKSLLSKTDILFLQEHWLSDDQLRLLGNINSNFVHARVSGFGNIEILSGRPFGGCAIYGGQVYQFPSKYFLPTVEEVPLFVRLVMFLNFCL